MPARRSSVRIDKWLWAARFFKTRSLAQKAIEGGHVELNEARPKSSRDVFPGDRLRIMIGQQAWSISVLALSERRGPAAEARKLYREDEDSIAARQRADDARRSAPNPEAGRRGRPDKKQRRELGRVRGR